MTVTVGTCMVTLNVYVCVCVSYQCGWWRQLVGPRPPFHPTDHTEKDGGRRGRERVREGGRGIQRVGSERRMKQGGVR